MMDENQVKRFMATSRQDFERYKETGDIEYLRDAAEKLFTSAENMVEYKTGDRINDYRDFKRLIPKVVEKKEDRIALMSKLSQLHVFHRHGLQEPNNIKDIVELYRNVHKEVAFLLESKKEAEAIA